MVSFQGVFQNFLEFSSKAKVEVEETGGVRWKSAVKRHHVIDIDSGRYRVMVFLLLAAI